LRTFLLVLFLLAAPCAHASQTVPPARIDSLVAAETRVHWATTLPESALADAKRKGLPVFLDFYATWCAPCRWMDRAVYSDPLLSEAAEAVAMVRVDVDTPDGKALAARYGILQYPTLVHLSPEGKETLRWVGPLTLRDTRLNLGQAAVSSSRRKDVEAAVAKHPADSGTIASAILFYGYRGEVENARRLETNFRVPAIDEPPAAQAPVLLALGKAEEFSGRDGLAQEAYRRAIAIDPDGLFAWRAWLGVSVCQEHVGQYSDALKAAQEALARGPKMPALEARVARLQLNPHSIPSPPGIED
jgi:thiol-disulfide isomerase/thioredoxin